MPEIPASLIADIWTVVKAAGILGTVVMWLAYRGARQDLTKEREKEDARHAATMDALNGIKVFMEIIRDRFPRT